MLTLRSIPLRCRRAQSSGEWPGSRIIFLRGFLGFSVIVGGVRRLLGFCGVLRRGGPLWTAAGARLPANWEGFGLREGVRLGLRFGSGGGSISEGADGPEEPDDARCAELRAGKDGT